MIWDTAFPFCVYLSGATCWCALISSHQLLVLDCSTADSPDVCKHKQILQDTQAVQKNGWDMGAAGVNVDQSELFSDLHTMTLLSGLKQKFYLQNPLCAVNLDNPLVIGELPSVGDGTLLPKWQTWTQKHIYCTVYTTTHFSCISPVLF